MSGKGKNLPRPLVSTRAQDVDARARLVLVLSRAMAKVGLFERPPQVQALAAELHREGVCLRSWAEKAIDATRQHQREEQSA